MSSGNLEEFCESQVCSVNPTYDTPVRDLQYKATNRWYNPPFESLDEFKADLNVAKSTYNITHLRTLIAQWGSLTPAQLTDTATVITQIFGSNIQPIIFTYDQFKTVTEEQAKTAVDISLSLFPSVAYWELINEPWGGSALYQTQSEIDAYHTKIRNVAIYLKSKITVPMTIGFANIQESFEKLQDLCDILCFHWYPCLATMFGDAYRKKNPLYYFPRLAPTWLQKCWTAQWEPNNQRNNAYPVKQSWNWLDDFIRLLDWMKTQANGRPYIINELGFSNEPGSAEKPGRYENCQACYFKLTLEAMRHYQDPNFQGYYTCHFSEPSYPDPRMNTWEAGLRRDKSPLPATAFFP